MFGSSKHQDYSKVEYASLRQNEDDDASSPRRDSINSSSPILDKVSIEEFDRESPGPVEEESGAFDLDGGLETFRRPIDEYEGAHRYDPHYRWSKAEEQKIVWKVC
jgi:broad specificity phosphatase PhoE